MSDTRLRCSECGHVGPPADFPVRRNRASGRSYWCRGCHSTYDAAKRVREGAKRAARRLRAAGSPAWALGGGVA